MLPFLVFNLVGAVLATSEEHPDRVTELPGAPTSPSFPLYSGYINVEIDDTLHRVFYVLCEAIHAEPLESPLVVWLNGGPGASSLMGLFLEHGPYILETDTGKLRYNDFSWNQYANVLYIESPTDVGFSHANKTIIAYNDDATEVLNVKALEAFMTQVHPRYVSRDFFLTGESYAGNMQLLNRLYIPFLARGILNGLNNGTFTNDRLKGIALGNPGMALFRTMSTVMQMFAMGMIPQNHGPDLFHQWEEMRDGVPEDWWYLHWDLVGNFSVLFDAIGNTTVYNIWHIAKPEKDIECSMDSVIEQFMNRKDVQKAMHAINQGDERRSWNIMSPIFYKYICTVNDIVPLYREILGMAKVQFKYWSKYVEDDFRVLFFTGDLDLACPAIHVARGATRIANQNDFEEIDDSPRIWRYLGDFGGALTSYKLRNSSTTMDVLTVRGAGHMVPTNKPSRAFQIINNFLFSNESPINYSKKIRRRK